MEKEKILIPLVFLVAAVIGEDVVAQNKVEQSGLLTEMGTETLLPSGEIISYKDPHVLIKFSKETREKIDLAFGIYSSTKKDFSPKYFMSLALPFVDKKNVKGEIKGKLIAPLDSENPNIIIQSSLKFKNLPFKLEAGYWNLLNGDYKNWLGVNFESNINETLKIRAKILQIFENCSTKPIILQFGLEKKLSNGWKVATSLQTQQFSSNYIDVQDKTNDFKIYPKISISHKFNIPENQRR